MYRPAQIAATFGLALAIPLAGCVTINTVKDGISRARIDETVAVGPLQLTPVKLVEDSRCPKDVQCISAGRVRVSVRIDGADPVELMQGQPLTLSQGTLMLVETYPERRKDWTLYSDEYRFGFTFTRQP